MYDSGKKYELAYLLTAFLERSQEYTKSEIETFIRQNVKAKIINNTGYAVDHIRRAMIDFQFLARTKDDRTYWVSENYIGLGEQDKLNLVKIENLIRDHPDQKTTCPFCPKTCYPIILMKHYNKRHERIYQWEKYMKELIESKWEILAEKYFNP
jgi:hypothetical protein